MLIIDNSTQHNAAKKIFSKTIKPNKHAEARIKGIGKYYTKPLFCEAKEERNKQTDKVSDVMVKQREKD